MYTYGGKLVLKRGREHVGEQLEGDGEEELHERGDDEDGKRNEAEQVLRRAPELAEPGQPRIPALACAHTPVCARGG